MAEINIEPKKKGPNWLWVIGIAVLIGAVIWLLTGNNKDKENTLSTTNTEAVSATNDANTEDSWRAIDFNAPKVDHEEVAIFSADFELRGNEKYTIYSMGENLLFDTDQATLRADAKQNLDQITASLKQRYEAGQIRIYGHADARADAAHNKQLSEQRAKAVRDWLVSNSGIEESRISIHPMGESTPVASNATQSGQQQNRRVEIVAMNP